MEQDTAPHEPLSCSALNTKEHEIRLVCLQPRASGETIACTIATANLDAKPAYEALSYEWADPYGERRCITVNSTKIQIRENLWWALYHLRGDNEPRTLWIDALCISQDDTRERNHQVGQMDKICKIYSQAGSVVAWIGREQTRKRNMIINDGPMAIAFLRGIEHKFNHQLSVSTENSSHWKFS